MAYTHQKTVTVYPVDDSYAWSNGGASWVTITQQGATDVWDFAVSDNTTYSNRSATCTVTHSNGTTDESFTIDQAAAAATAPSVNMVNVTVSSNTSLIGNGNVSSENGSSLTGRGFWFGPDPTRSNNTQYPIGPNNVIGNIQNTFTGLTPSTTYYCWAYATNAVGTTYSPVTTQATSAATTYTVSTSLNDTANGCAFVSSDVAQPAGNSPVSPMVSAAGLAGTVVTQEFWIQPEAGYMFHDATGGITTALSSVVPSNTVVSFANTLTANGNIKIVMSTTIPTSNVTQIFNMDGTATTPYTTVAPGGWLNFTTPVTNNNSNSDFTASELASYTTFFFEYGGDATDPVVADFTLTADMPPSVISMGVINNTSNPKTGSVSLSYGANPNLTNGYHDFYYNKDTSHASQNVRGHWIDITQTAASPMNGIWASGGVDDPATDFTSFTPGYIANTYNRNPQLQGMAAPFEITMDPDVYLNAADRWWSTEPTGYVGGNLSGTKDVTNPWWVGGLVIDNTVTPHSAELDYYIGVDPSGPSPSPSSTPEGNTSPIGFNDFGGSSGGAEITAGGPTPPGGNSNHPMTYCIVRHPDDYNNYISIRYDGDNTVSTTTAPPYTFTFTGIAPSSQMGSSNPTGGVDAYFEWVLDGTTTPGPTINASNFSIELPVGGTSSITSMTMNGGGNAHTGTVNCSIEPDSGNVNTSYQTISVDFTASSGTFLTGGSVNTITFQWQPCIVYGQPILMADGTTKLVEDILVGDEVKAISISGLGLEEGDYKTWSTSDFSSSDATTIITRATHGSYETYHLLSFSEGSDLKITHEHPVLSNRAGEYAFRRVDELLVNDEVFNAESGWVTLTSNTLISETAQTVSLGAETADNYFAQGILVHNDPNAK